MNRSYFGGQVGPSAGMQVTDRHLPSGLIRGGIDHTMSVRITSESSLLYLSLSQPDRCRSLSGVQPCHLKEEMLSLRFGWSKLITLLNEEDPEVPLNILPSSPKRAGALRKDTPTP